MNYQGSFVLKLLFLWLCDEKENICTLHLKNAKKFIKILDKR